MLALDSPRWSELTHVYGKATDIPDLLRQLEAAPSHGISDWNGVWNELWNELYEALCHGGVSIDTASYAALPHYCRIGAGASLETVWGYFCYIASVEVLRLRGEGPPIPEFLQRDYEDALATVPEWAFSLSQHPWDFLLCSTITAALSASKGQADLSWVLSELSSDNIKSVSTFLEGRDEQDD